MMKNMENIEKTFLAELNLIRNDLTLLESYKFDKNSPDSKHFDRLRLNIAMYNDLRDSDFQIAKFLFQQEIEWRKTEHYYEGNERIENLYFCAFLLTCFKQPEIVIDFCRAKNIDMDSGSGFDSEYLVAVGTETTYQFLDRIDSPYKEDIFWDIGDSYETCYFSEDHMQKWKSYKKQSFENYRFPIQNLLMFLYQTNQKTLFSEQFKIWLNSQIEWNIDNSEQYLQFAKYIDDKDEVINALRLMIKYTPHDFLVEIYEKEINQLLE